MVQITVNKGISNGLPTKQLVLKHIQDTLQEAPKTHLQIGPYEFLVGNSFDQFNKAQIKKLLESSFGKVLVSDYFDSSVTQIIVEKNYKAVAIVKTIDGVSYLDKIAVLPECQGNGLAKSLWQTLTSQYESFMWRAVKSNPINGWYAKQATGFQETKDWIVFWIGISVAQAETLIQTITELPPTLIKNSN